MDNDQSPGGYITFVMADDQQNTIIELGGAEFSTQNKLDQEWENIPSAEEQYTVFYADKETIDCDIVEDKPVTADTIERYLSKPIGELIGKGRKNTSTRGSV